MIWQGRLDLQGDPGERRGFAIELDDRTGDGHPDVIVGAVREDTYICGQPPALLAPRAVHPEELELRPVVLRRLPELPPGTVRTLTPSPVSPGPTDEPVVRALHFRRASSAYGVAPDSPTRAPHGLGDGDPATAWVEGAGQGTYEFATAAWAGGASLPIRALSIVPRPTGAFERTTQMPTAIWLVGDQGAPLRVALPADARPGERFWIVPPEPLASSCLSVILDAGDAAGGSHIAIADIAAYSEVDFGGGIPHLIAELSAGADRADRAEALLGGMGAAAVEAIDGAFTDMPESERIRAVRALSRLARNVPTAL
ncbi:MAG: hypothetical protein H5U40_04295, partial [Polyangiaceae bacterium]|nr:hypothetical protein [Polyangiaceae bacterium]